MAKESESLTCSECGHETAISHLHRSMIDTPCAQCGASMLTLEEYECAKRAQVAIWIALVAYRIMAFFSIKSRESEVEMFINIVR